MKTKDELANQSISLLNDLMNSNVGETATIVVIAQNMMRVFNDETINKKIQDIMFSQRAVVKKDNTTATNRSRIIGGKIVSIDATQEEIEDTKKKIVPSSGQQSKVAQTVDEPKSDMPKVESNEAFELVKELAYQDPNIITESLGVENALKLVQQLGHKFQKEPTRLGVIKKLKELLIGYVNENDINKIQTVNEFVKSI